MSLLDAKLPDSWTWQSISDRFRITKKPRDLNFANSDAIPFVPMEAVPTNGREDMRFEIRTRAKIASGTYFEKGDILLSKITPSFENGKQGLATNIPAGFGMASTEIIPLQPVGAESNRFFLFYYLLHPEVRFLLAGKMEGSTGRQRVPENAVREFPIPVPPTPEQEKIAAVLRKVQRAIEVEAKLVVTALELKQSAMQHLFSRGLCNEAQKETDLGFVPESWDIVPIRSVAKLMAGGTPSRKVRDYWEGGTIPWVKTGEVDYCVISDTSEKITDAGLQNSAAKILPPGTLLVAMYGQGITRGKVALLGIEAATNQACVGLIPHEDDFRPLYLYYYLTFAYERLRALSHGAHQQNLNAELIRDFEFPIPTDENERNSIVDTLQAIDRKISIHERKRAALLELFKTLLHKLMTGEISVAELDIDTSNVTQF